MSYLDDELDSESDLGSSLTCGLDSSMGSFFNLLEAKSLNNSKFEITSSNMSVVAVTIENRLKDEIKRQNKTSTILEEC